MIVKQINGFENYTIDEYGTVINTFTGKIKKPFVDSKNRYLLIDLSKNNKRYRFLVHRLVAISFLENTNNLPVVNHKDDTTTNNHYKNLEWCTTQYNVHQTYKHTPPTRNFIVCLVKKGNTVVGEFENKKQACKFMSLIFKISSSTLSRYAKTRGFELIEKCND